LNVRLLIIKPIDRWLSEEKAEEGYWGFVRCREDYEKEKTNIHRQIEDLIANLRGEGIEVDLLPTIEIENVDDLLERTEDLRKADVNLVLTLFPAGWISAGDLSYGIVATSNYVVFYDQFRPNIYAGTLFNPPMYKRLEEHKLSDKIFLCGRRSGEAKGYSESSLCFEKNIIGEACMCRTHELSLRRMALI